MKASKEEYAELCNKIKAAEKRIAALEERRDIALSTWNERVKELDKLTAGKDAEKVLEALEKEIETRLEWLRSKVVELEQLVVDFRSGVVSDEDDISAILTEDF